MMLVAPAALSASSATFAQADSARILSIEFAGDNTQLTPNSKTEDGEDSSINAIGSEIGVAAMQRASRDAAATQLLDPLDSAEAALRESAEGTKTVSGSVEETATVDRELDKDMSVASPQVESSQDHAYTATIDLSTTVVGGEGFTVSGTTPAYTNPSYPTATANRTVAFGSGANGKTYLIMQSMSCNNPLPGHHPLQDASIYSLIYVQSGVDVTLIIKDIYLTGIIEVHAGASLTMFLDGTNHVRGTIHVPDGAELTLDSLSGDDTQGRLNMPSDVSPAKTSASIGGVGPEASTGNGGPSGTITINGGTLDIVTHSAGAAIGGGGAGYGVSSSGSGGNGGKTTINGGVVKIYQTGTNSIRGDYVGGAGIGGGGNGGNGGEILITDGTIDIEQITRGAGIGGGTFGTAGNIKITGGAIKVKSHNKYELSTGTSGTGAGIGSGGGTNFGGPGGMITITDGDIDVDAYYTAIGKAGGTAGRSLDIYIIGGDIQARGHNGPGIGFWANSFGDEIKLADCTIYACSELRNAIGGDDAAHLIIDDTADIQAYSKAAGRPAIYGTDNYGTGHFVNAGFTQPSHVTNEQVLQVYERENSATLLKTLTVSKDFYNFAYSTQRDSLRNDIIIRKVGGIVTGAVVRDYDGNPTIYSIKTRDGYDPHNQNLYNDFHKKGGYKLPVRVDNARVVTEKYRNLAGNEIRPDTYEVATSPSYGYSKVIPTVKGYTVLGYSLGSYTPPSYTPGASVTINQIASATTVFFIYGEPPTLTVTKAVAGEYSDKGKTFLFSIYLMDSSGDPLHDYQTYQYEGDVLDSIVGAIPPQNGELDLDDQGRGQILLKHGQSITLLDIPTSGKVRIVEENGMNYLTTHLDSQGTDPVENADTGEQALSGGARTFAFTNIREPITESSLDLGSLGKPFVLIAALLLGSWVGLILGIQHNRMRGGVI